MHPAEVGELEAFRDLYAAAPEGVGADDVDLAASRESYEGVCRRDLGRRATTPHGGRQGEHSQKARQMGRHNYPAAAIASRYARS
jgi:hypothetical protein